MTTKVEFLDAYDRIKTADSYVTASLAAAIDHEEHEEHSDAIASYKQAAECIDETFTIPIGMPDKTDDITLQWLDACSIIKKLKATKETVEKRITILEQQQKQQKNSDIDHTAEEAVENIHINNSRFTEHKENENNGNEDEPLEKKRSILMENPNVANDKGNTIKTYKKYVGALREILDHHNYDEEQKDDEIQFDKIYQAPVKLYKISNNGTVETIAGESIMSLIMCSVIKDESKWQFLNGTSFMQCTIPISAALTSREDASCSSSSISSNMHNFCWIYPLLPNVTTCYRTEYGAFIFPDIETLCGDIESSAFGIMLSNETRQIDDESFADMQKFFLDLLEAIIAGEIGEYTSGDFITQGVLDIGQLRKTRDVSEKISQGIIKSADFIARTIIRGAEKTGEFLDHNTPYLISKIQGAPQNANPVSSTVQTTVSTAKTVTGVAASATGWVAGKIGVAAYKVGSYLAPHVEAQSVNMLEHGFGYEKNEAESKVKGVMTLAAGAIEGFTTVYTGLEKSADVLGKSLSDNSVKIISHKYGNSAGDVAANTFDTIGNSWHINKNIKIFRPKGFAEKVVKKTSKGVMDDYHGSLRGNKNIIKAGELEQELWDPQTEKNETDITKKIE